MRIYNSAIVLLFVILSFISFSGAAAAQAIGDVDPGSGSVLVPITISGSGFGAAKSKVVFEKANPTKKLTLTILLWSDTEIIGALPSGALGTYDVKVTPKGGATITSPGAFQIVAPGIEELFTIVPDLTAVGETLTILGHNFGGKKGTVKFGKTTAKILSWADTSVTITVPKLKDGSYILTLTNTLGSDTKTITVGAHNTGFVTGLAAKGAAIPNATITIHDRLGATTNGGTNANGIFTINVAGASLPFLVKLDVPGGGTLYSMADKTGDLNIDTVTDLLVRCWYRTQGTTADAAFANITANPLPGPLQLRALYDMLAELLGIWLAQAGVDVNSFDYLTTPFTANGQGFDLVLTQMAVQENGGNITVHLQDTPSSPQLIQDSTITFDTVTESLQVSTTTTGTGGASSDSKNKVFLSNDPAVVAAINGINACFAQFQSIINTKGYLLKSTDVNPVLATSFLSEGRSATIFAAELATDFRGATIQSGFIKKLTALDSVTGVADVDFILYINGGGQTFTDTGSMKFKKTGNAWKMFGDQRIAEISADFELDIEIPGFSPHFSNPTPRVNIDVRGPVGTIASVTVTGGGIFNNTPLIKHNEIAITTFQPTPTTQIEYKQEAFFVADFPGSPIPAGTPFTITITPVSGPQVVYTLFSQSSTSEGITVSQPTGSTLADAKLGQILHFAWTLPVTFPIAKIDASGFALSSSAECSIEALQQFFSTTTTDADFIFPTTCDGNAVTQVNLNLSITGKNGERVHVTYMFQ